MAYRERQKISQMTPKGADLDATDLIEVSTLVSGSYVTKSITGQEIINTVTPDLTGYVPYVGATQDVDLDTNKISARSVYIEGTAGNGHLHLKHQSADATATGQSTALYADSNGDLKYKNDNDYYTTLRTSTNTADRVYTFPNETCTLTPESRIISTTAPLTGGGDLSANRTLSIPKATTSVDGYLSKADWTNFDSKQNALVSGTSIKTVQSTTLLGSGDVTITDANLSMSDITTNNVSITQHGFVPKAPNDTTKFLRGDGTWATAGGGLTIGTTAITSGTVGRILFEGTGNVLQEDSALFWDNTNKRLGVGATPSTSRLNVLSTNNTDADMQIRIGSTDAATRFYTIGRESANGQLAFRWGGEAGALGAQFYFPVTTFNTITSSSSDQGTARLRVINTGGGRAFALIAGVHNTTQANFSLYDESAGVTRFIIDGNGNLGLGTNTASPGARLDVRAQGALSTDIAFRVRNSANTANVSEFRGNGVGIVCGISTARAIFSPYNAHGGDGFILTTQDLAPNVNPTKAAMFMTEGYTNFYGTGGTQSISFAVDTAYGGTTRQWQFSNLNLNDGALYIGTGNSATNNRRMFLTDSAVLNIGKDTMGNTQSGTNQLRILNGTAPTSLATDTFALYSADIIAGNAAPHFRTENGNIIKLYRETTAVAAATLVGNAGTNITDTDTFDGYTLKQIVKALRNQGLLA